MEGKGVMDDRRYEQIAAGSGFLLIVLSVIGFGFAPTPPGASESAEKVASYFADNHQAILIQSYAGLLLVAVFLWFVGSLRSFLRSAEGGTGRLSALAFGGGVMATTVILITTLVTIVLAHASKDGADPATIRVVFGLVDVGIPILDIPFAVMFAATGLVALRKHAFPAWLGWLSLALALIYLVLAAGIFVRGGPLGSGGAITLGVGFAFLVWIIAITVVMIRRLGQPLPQAR